MCCYIIKCQKINIKLENKGGETRIEATE